MKIFKWIALIFISIAFNNCNSGQDEKDKIHYIQKEEFELVPLAAFSYIPANIKPGTEVEILANFGGPPSSGDTVYYYQFIVLNKETNDTIRILTPVITIEPSAGEARKTSTSPLGYNITKGVTNASFQLIDSSENLLLNGENMSRLTSGDTAGIEQLLNPANAKKIVVLDKNVPENEISRFRCAIGVLHFKQIPW